MTGPAIRDLARILWDYACLAAPPSPASVLVGLGSYDLRVADRVAELWLQGLAPAVIFSGGWGAWTTGRWTRPEAEMFAERAIARGLDPAAITLEPRSTNTGENVRFVRPMLPGPAIWVCKPQMTRRVRATLDAAGLGPDHQVAAPLYGFDGALDGTWLDEAALVDELVGVHARLRGYPALGFQSPQPPDAAADAAFARLRALGFGGALPPELAPRG
jgi:uncharacterized SAM-binding protein YcdF (DUF218 family)